MDLMATMRAYAQEHYHQDSWDCLLRWDDHQLATALRGAKTRRGAIAKCWAYIQRIDAARDGNLELIAMYGPRPVKAVSLFTFLAAAGGVAPHPELQAVLDGSPWVGGHGPLVRRNGLPLDDARRAAVEAGYLYDTSWEGGVATSTVNDLIDAIADEARGLKLFPNGEYGEDPASDTYAEESCYEEDVPF